jgi:hypothetical protein
MVRMSDELFIIFIEENMGYYLICILNIRDNVM